MNTLLPTWAIDKAIKGGWRAPSMFGTWFFSDGVHIKYQKQSKAGIPYDNDYHPISETLLDPSFWSALGKSLGWANDYWNYEYRLSADETRRQGHVRYAEGMALYLHELILTNQDTAPYWEELKPKV